MVVKWKKPKWRIEQRRRVQMKLSEFQAMKKRVRENETKEEFKPREDWNY